MINKHQYMKNRMVDGIKLPPPLTDINNNISSQRFNHALLHQAFASCGRFLSCLLLWLTAASLLASCSKADPEDEPKPERVVLNDSTLTTPVDTTPAPAILVDTTWADTLRLSYDDYDAGDADEAAARAFQTKE